MSIRIQDATAGGYAAGSYDGGHDEPPDLGPPEDRYYVQRGDDGRYCVLDRRGRGLDGAPKLYASGLDRASAEECARNAGELNGWQYPRDGDGRPL